MIKRNLYTNKGRTSMILDKTMEDVILDVLKDQDDYFVDCEFVKDCLDDFYCRVFSLQRIQKILNHLYKDNLVIMKHTLRKGHKKYFSHPDNHLNKMPR